MKKNIKYVLVILALSFITALILSGCGEEAQTQTTGSTGTEQDTMQNVTKNSDTTEILDDFSYLSYNTVNDDNAIKAQSYDDIVTVLFVRHSGGTRNTWLYDAKRSTLFYSLAPYKDGMPKYYKKLHDMTDAEKKTLSATLKAAGTHDWKQSYEGKDTETGSVLWFIYIEYKSGVIEKHSSRGFNSGDPDKEARSIYDLLSSFKFIDNPLY